MFKNNMEPSKWLVKFVNIELQAHPRKYTRFIGNDYADRISIVPKCERFTNARDYIILYMVIVRKS